MSKETAYLTRPNSRCFECSTFIACTVEFLDEEGIACEGFHRETSQKAIRENWQYWQMMGGQTPHRSEFDRGLHTPEKTKPDGQVFLRYLR